MTFGEKLSKLRKAYNYTQEQLADDLGVSRQSVSKWELDLAYPETEKLIELGRLFECSMDYLLREDVTEKNVVSAVGFAEKVEKLGKKVWSDRTRGKAKRMFKIVGWILAGLLVIDVISMIVYFSVVGIPW